MDGKRPLDLPANGKRRLYPAAEARQLLGGISKMTFHRLVTSGELKVVRQGARVYVEPEAIDAYIERLRSVA